MSRIRQAGGHDDNSGDWSDLYAHQGPGGARRQMAGRLCRIALESLGGGLPAAVALTGEFRGAGIRAL